MRRVETVIGRAAVHSVTMSTVAAATVAATLYTAHVAATPPFIQHEYSKGGSGAAAAADVDDAEKAPPKAAPA